MVLGLDVGSLLLLKRLFFLVNHMCQKHNGKNSLPGQIIVEGLLSKLVPSVWPNLASEGEVLRGGGG